jgi:UDP-hydrolysing UDP-N-acetyl-D-glucosamine 2-epimerase
MKSIQKNKKLKLQVIIGSAGVLDRFGNMEKQILSDGFPIDYKVYTIVEGENPLTMAKSAGLGIVEISSGLDLLKPDILLVVGDRFDVISPVIAATYMNIRVAHTMGGEVTGTIDESVRHAITKFAHFHFPANQESANRIIRMGENPKHVYMVGCPRIDTVNLILKNKINSKKLSMELNDFKGVSFKGKLDKDFLIVSMHPVTTEFGLNRQYMESLLNVLNDLKIQTIMLWPNADAGSDEISKAIRSFREKVKPEWLSLFINLPFKTYTELMVLTKCLIGNSSSGIREGAFIGTPCVNIGSRQNGRQKGRNVIDADNNEIKIKNAILKQMKNGHYSSDSSYGRGCASEEIVKVLCKENPPLQKIFVD